ncbi:4Fe-4S dicluster domain-containing protein [Leptobacterium flavescens]|uniref:4Fe-4S dicluster domain-containing protein n=1 Tax=Leptobacterium flavescens TaxID=472055 RepID=A0A6P0UHA8_9FLAO|nr:thiamine pyrophosphate-dependent enzyme [Leptobacterium flavescens]NER11850.1 4Fe-4S dicluster domain-containing protein [Leptobacterium flavescens]
MKTQKHIVLNGNQAAAHIAYKTNELFAIYPITPASGMSELVEEWSAGEQKNIFGDIPQTFEMQSEGGVAGAMHGALQKGSLSATFTASQGLLLMMPNMYKIAGELTPNVIHVATRTVATHALSVFGDHSDIMAVRNTGYAFLGAASVQEAMDFSLIAQAATLESRIPFVHFFDGFRTSHECNTIEMVTDETIREMMNEELIKKHRQRALNPNSPVIRGTAQASDVFFQSREAINPFYQACPDIVQKQMDAFASLTGRQYRLFDYVGHPEAERIIISMASSTETIEETVNYLNAQGEKTGLVKVRLFRPFSTKHLINAIPKSCKAIAVLDRTKEPGSAGEPLYLDVVSSLMEEVNSRKFIQFPKITGGRYGLSSKELDPPMIKAVFENLKQDIPKNNFTIGINDDITHLSLDYQKGSHLKTSAYQAVFYEKKSEKAINSFNELVRHIAEETGHYVQAYSECDYKKSSSRRVSHLRLDTQPIKAPYLIGEADFIACDGLSFLKNDNVLDKIKTGGTLLINTSLKPEEFWEALSVSEQKQIQKKEVVLYTLDISDFNEDAKISGLQKCFLAIKNGTDPGIEELFQRVDTSIIGKTVDQDALFSGTLLGKLLNGKRDELPLSVFPVDGTYPTDTSVFNSIEAKAELPEWKPDLCTQCGACSMACPQAVLRIKVYDDDKMNATPPALKSIKAVEWDPMNYTIQINPDQCTSCNNCIDACPSGALKMTNRDSVLETEKQNWKYFERIPEFDRKKLDTGKVSQQQLQQPLFKYSPGIDACGEAPYLKLLSQLFGDRMLVANATGASSIFGGSLPTTPWSKDEKGRGPAWSNSLFEDNAEFGLGFRLSLDQQEEQARQLLIKIKHKLDSDLVNAILKAEQLNETEIAEQRDKISVLKDQLKNDDSPDAQRLITIADSLVKQSVWIVGGDGWAYDIGYGGLDHAIASGKNINILVLDNEVYDNTGGQMSKATPLGASAKFAVNGKQKQKKDLGMLAMTYEDVYVASVAIGADQEQTLKALKEAESYDGPSLIIAYCHSASHGIDMRHPQQYHKAAVDSGQWLLYRNDPRRVKKGLSPLQLDSVEPEIDIETYLRMEKRFDKLFAADTKSFKGYISEYREQIRKRYNTYKFLQASQEYRKSKKPYQDEISTTDTSKTRTI